MQSWQEKNIKKSARTSSNELLSCLDKALAKQGLHLELIISSLVSHMNRPFSRLSAFLLLCLYCWSCTPLSSFAFATLAEISGEHEVRIQWADSGVRVILRHQVTAAPTVEVSDHQRPLTKALSSLCSLNSQGDHVFARSSEPYTEATAIRGARACQIAKASASDTWSITHLCGCPVTGLSSQAKRLIHGKMDRSSSPREGLGTIVLLV